MMMILRSMEYEDLLDMVYDQKVAVWTCNTCARLCNGLGGKDAADRLAAKLKKDGVDVISSTCVSAACLMAKVMSKTDELRNAEVIIALTCETGAECASLAFKIDVLAPLTTVGHGFEDDDGSLMVISCDGEQTMKALDKIAEEKGMSTEPLA